MKTFELRIIDNQYTIIIDGRPSSTTFSTKFRLMAINKFKFSTKNTVLPIRAIVEDEYKKIIFDKEITNYGELDTIK